MRLPASEAGSPVSSKYCVSITPVQGHGANALVTIALDVSAPGETTGVNRKTDETKSE